MIGRKKEPYVPPVERNVIPKYKTWSDEKIKADLQAKALPFSVAMMQLQGDFNIGTLVRNANAFGAREVFYVGNKKWDRRGAVGTYHYIDVKHFYTVDEFLDYACQHYTLIALEGREQVKEIVPELYVHPIFSYTWPEEPVCMIFGEEGAGLGDDVLYTCDQAVEIPQTGSVPSLNVGVASGIAMASYVAQYSKLNEKELIEL